MVLMRVLRDIVDRHDMKLWQVPADGGKRRTGWGHLYKRRGTAKYPVLSRDLDGIRGITGEERIEALSANLGAMLIEGIEEFAIHLLLVVIPTDDHVAVFSQALARHDLTEDDIRDRLIRSGEPAASDEPLHRILFRGIMRRKIDKPDTTEGENTIEIWREQDAMSLVLARVRSDLTRLLVDRVEIDIQGQGLFVHWTHEMDRAMVRVGIKAVDTDLYQLNGEHLWIDLSDGEDS